MGLKDFFKPKWKHSDSVVRRKALIKIDDQAILAEVASSDPQIDIRKEALRRLTLQSAIAKVAKNASDVTIHEAAIEKLTDQSAIADVAKNGAKGSYRMHAVFKLNDQSLLGEISKHDNDALVRKSAVIYLNDENLLKEISTNDSDEEVRKAAANKLESIVGTGKYDEHEKRTTPHCHFSLPDGHLCAKRQHNLATDKWENQPGSLNKSGEIEAALSMKNREVFLKTVSGEWISFDEYFPERFNDWVIDFENCDCDVCSGKKVLVYYANIARWSATDNELSSFLESELHGMPHCVMERLYGGKRQHELLMIMVQSKSEPSSEKWNQIAEKIGGVVHGTGKEMLQKSKLGNLGYLADLGGSHYLHQVLFSEGFK